MSFHEWVKFSDGPSAASGTSDAEDGPREDLESFPRNVCGALVTRAVTFFLELRQCSVHVGERPL